jgi:DAK2 domain fusion protein YloV
LTCAAKVARKEKAVTAVDALDAATVRRWAGLAAAELERVQDEINGLNVFPIPDRDTGTNMALTARSAQRAAAAETADDVGAVLAALAGGAVQGARGNSGVILSQLWRGLADLPAGRTWGPGDLSAGLSCAADRAYGAVGDPVEGTILTVARAAATGASAAPRRLEAVVAGAVNAAREALSATTVQLEALHAAGVVDAGGRGLVVVLEALLGSVRGDEAPAGPVSPTVAAALTSTDRTTADRLSGSVGHIGLSSFGLSSHDLSPHLPASYEYEVQYLLEADASAVDRLRQELGTLGDSVAVADGGDGHWNVHVHVDDVGAAIEAGVRAGRPHRIEVTRFADQITDQITDRASEHGADQRTDQGADHGTDHTTDQGGVAIVAVGLGPGLAELFRGEGVLVLPAAHPDSPAAGHPDADEVLAAIRSCGTGSVILLPDPSSDAGRAGDACEEAASRARAEGIVVAVLPNRSAVQALAAVAVHDPTRRFQDDVIRMAETAAGTRWAEVTIAAGEALTSAGRCQAGDVLGLIAGEVVVIGSDPLGVGITVLDRLLGVGGELVTVLLGRAAPPRIGEGFAAHLARSAPHLEVEVLFAGQPGPMLLFGVE